MVKDHGEKAIVATIKAEAEKCCQALVAGDHEAFVPYTHDRLITMLGGKDAMVAMLRKGTAQMLAEGTTIEKVEIGEIAAPRDVGGWLVTLVPQTIKMKVSGGRLETRSFLIAVSEDGGKRWVFLDAAGFHKPQFLTLFPELETLDVPLPTEPTFTPEP